MPQHFVLYPHLTVWENLNFAASLYGMPLWRGGQLKRMLDFVELRDQRGKLARDISGGMQRRLSLAATLVHDPDFVFLDEPTAGIDPVLRRGEVDLVAVAPQNASESMRSNRQAIFIIYNDQVDQY
ncbi:MAG: ATP-binding cassette domain-containing protein [Chloroflexi bacterium]|nr:ATP-binding cassette domain-containing protein [Chloroflexota bacterium]